MYRITCRVAANKCIPVWRYLALLISHENRHTETWSHQYFRLQADAIGLFCVVHKEVLVVAEDIQHKLEVFGEG